MSQFQALLITETAVIFGGAAVRMVDMFATAYREQQQQQEDDQSE